MMIKIEQIQQDIDNLPEEAQLLLIDFIELLKKRYLPIPDTFIAATAIILNLPLHTKNQNHYRFIPEINLLSYP